MTMLPTMTLSNAAACAANFAPTGERAPIRLPTRAEAATPIPKGSVLRTIQHLSLFHDSFLVYVLWSVVMMIDCAARGISPSRPAANATISKAALSDKLIENFTIE